jgi:F-box and leucine-rich repeat protein 14
MNPLERCAAALVLSLVAAPPHVLAADAPPGSAEPPTFEVASADAARALDGTVSRVRLPAGATDEVVAGLAHLKGLTSVIAPDAALTDAGLRSLADRGTLRELDLSRCPGVTAAGLKVLGAMKRLEVVRLCGNTGLDDASLAPLGKLPKLRVADLSDCTRLGDGAIKALRDLDSLEELSLVGVRLTLAGTTQLARLQGLKVLRLDRTSIPDEAMLNIVVLRNLETLAVSGNPDFGWIGLLHLGGLRKLRALEANGLPNLTDEALQRASKMETLESIDVSNCARLSDAGIAALAALPRLRAIDVSRTHATGKSLLALVKSKSLRSLRAAGCPDLKPEDLEAVRAAAPTVSIVAE